MEKADFPWEIRAAHREEWQDAMALAWKTFLKFEACDYTEEGVKSFQEFITDNTVYRMFLAGSYELFVAMEGRHMIGMITVRCGSHVSLLFVDEKYHRQGIGRALVKQLTDYMAEEMGIRQVTVNASPYGVGFYHKLGFRDLRPEEQKDGIIYTPMELKF